MSPGKGKSFVREVLRITIVLAIWFVLVDIEFNLAQGPDRVYGLGNGYEIVCWPGPIIRWNVDENVPVEQHYYEKIIEAPVTAFYVDSTWIAGQTTVRWFAINKETGEVYYPYKSHEELCTATGFTFSPDKLITKRPRSYEVIWAPANRVRAVAIISILAIIPLIGFRRFGRIIAVVFKIKQKKLVED